MDAIQDLDLITTVDLSYEGDGNRPVYHFIYASQLYGTLFAIYAKFDGNNNGTTFEVNKITMRMINYKGVLNIGFTNDFSRTGNEIDFGVRAASKDVEKIVSIVPPIPVTKGTSFPMTFNRTLHPLQDFQSYQTNPVGPIGSEPPPTELFDSEFYERDGVDFYKHEPRGGMEGYQPPVPLGPFITGPRCRESNVSLRF